MANAFSRGRAFTTLRGWLESYYLATALFVAGGLLCWRHPWLGGLALALAVGLGWWRGDVVTRLHGGVTLRAHYGPLVAVEFFEDGAGVRATSRTGAVIEWDVDARRLRRVITGTAVPLTPTARSPDGQCEAALHGRRAMEMRDVTTGRVTTILRGHRGLITALAFSPDGERLASASQDGTVKLWRVP